MSGAELYAAMVAYVEQNGWSREEPGHGWWVDRDSSIEATLGEAVEEQLARENIDIRYGPFVAAPTGNKAED